MYAPTSTTPLLIVGLPLSLRCLHMQRCLPGFGKGNGVKNPCVLCDPDTQIVDPNSKK